MRNGSVCATQTVKNLWKIGMNFTIFWVSLTHHQHHLHAPHHSKRSHGWPAPCKWWQNCTRRPPWCQSGCSPEAVLGQSKAILKFAIIFANFSEKLFLGAGWLSRIMFKPKSLILTCQRSLIKQLSELSCPWTPTNDWWMAINPLAMSRIRANMTNWSPTYCSLAIRFWIA